MQNFRSIESLRAYMAWWVVLSHSLGLIGIYDTGTTLLNLPIKLISWASVPVNVFIIVSGFVITHLLIAKKENYSAYITRRFFRIFPIYLFCLFLAVALLHLRQIAFVDMSFIADKTTRIAITSAEHENFWTHLFLHTTMLHGLVPDSALAYSTSAFLGPAWSLSLEWQFYLVAPVVIGLMARSLISMAITFAVLFSIGFFVRSGALGHWNYPAFLFMSIQYFLIGITSRLLLDKFKDHSFPWELFLVAIITLSLANLIESTIWLFCYLIVLTEANRIKNIPSLVHKVFQLLMLNNLVASLGRWSYSTYLIHIPLLTLVVGGFGYFFGTHISLPLLITLVAVCMPLILVASWLLYSTVEVGGIALGKRLVNRLKRRNLVNEAALDAPV